MQWTIEVDSGGERLHYVVINLVRANELRTPNGQCQMSQVSLITCRWPAFTLLNSGGDEEQKGWACHGSMSYMLAMPKLVLRLLKPSPLSLSTFIAAARSNPSAVAVLLRKRFTNPYAIAGHFATIYKVSGIHQLAIQSNIPTKGTASDEAGWLKKLKLVKTRSENSVRRKPQIRKKKKKDLKECINILFSDHIRKRWTWIHNQMQSKRCI